MNKEVAKHVVERSGMLCEVCGSNQGVQLHHIIGGPSRSTCETKESVVALCLNHHTGAEGVHNGNTELDRRLKKRLEAKYIAMGYSDEKIRHLMGGRRYL